tara:strand:- start:442 stop:834 length:393 start_codon:yes stop_codon:yes gene_type:complete
MTTFIGRGPGTSPTTDFFPLSAALASSPVINIAATSATAGGTTIHVADARAYDIPIIYVANVGSTSNVVAFLQMGSTATTQSIPITIATSSYALIQPGTPISGSGTIGIWCSASGVVAYGGVTRTYTASA